MMRVHMYTKITKQTLSVQWLDTPDWCKFHALVNIFETELNYLVYDVGTVGSL